MTENKIVYIGKIIELQDIPNSDFIQSATVICGSGGKWKGVVKKDDFCVGWKCIVYLPDALIPESEEMAFMKSSNWRVRMRRFRGAPSEVVITPRTEQFFNVEVGTEISEQLGVIKYFKPIPVNLACQALGNFPSFIPKTDEPNYQNQEGQEGIEKLIGKPFYITEKCDGSSTTAYRYKEHFGVCSRNLELKVDENNAYWQIARKYDLENKLPEGIAIQWETCGPKIQNNPMGLKEITGYVFSGYKIDQHRYLTFDELLELCKILSFPMAKVLILGTEFNISYLDRASGVYSNGKPREGIVIRSQENLLGHKPISFKVINLDYDK